MKLEKEQINKNSDAICCGEDFPNDNNKKYEQICLVDKNIEKLKKNKDKKLESSQLNMNGETEVEKEKLEEAEQVVKKQSSKKKKIWNLIFFLINIGVVAGILTYQILNEDGLTSITKLAGKLNWWIVLLLAFSFVMINFLDALKFWILTYKTTKKSRISLSYKLSALGKYYDNITPFASGEQPFQIYYLRKNGVGGADSLSITMGRFVIWQISFVVFSLIVMISSISLNNFSSTGTAIVTASSWIGFSFIFALFLLVGFISISKKVGTKLITGILKLLHKMKIVKNYDKQYHKVMQMVDDYQSTMKRYAKDKWSFISIIIISYISFLFYYSLPFIIHAAFYGFDFSIFATIFTYCVMIELTASFLPLPGGTGAAELSFTALFGAYFIDGNLFWAMIIWRILTYYGPLLQGLIIIIYDYLVGNKRFQWEEKKWKLEAESRAFEENHLREFELSLKESNKVKHKRRKKR